MRAWKGLVVFILAVGLAGYFGCTKGGKYGDAKSVMSRSIKVMESFINDMEKAEDSKSVVKAINAFSADMSELKPKLQAMEKKYPELKDQENPPEELKPMAKQIEELSGRMMSAMMKLFQYGDDPEVQKASEAMNKLMMDEN